MFTPCSPCSSGCGILLPVSIFFFSFFFFKCQCDVSEPCQPLLVACENVQYHEIIQLALSEPQYITTVDHSTQHKDRHSGSFLLSSFLTGINGLPQFLAFLITDNVWTECKTKVSRDLVVPCPSVSAYLKHCRLLR